MPSSASGEPPPGGWPLYATAGELGRVLMRYRPSAGPRPAASDASFGAFPPYAGRMHFMSTGLYLPAAAHAACATASAA